MSNLAKISKEIQPREFTKDQLELIKATVARGASDDEMKLFLYRCQHMGLDPLKPGQVHFIKYGSNPGTIVIGIDGFRSKAAKTGKHVGTRRGVVRDESGKMIGAWAEVFRSDWQHPAREEVPLSEYNTGKGNWQKMPETMIKKVAEVAALRMAFPDELGGLYSEEEMHQASPRTVAEIPHSESAPDFEAIEIDPFEEPEVELTLGDYEIKAGQNKGKRLKDLSKVQVERFLSWFADRSAAGDAMHPNVVEYAEKAREYLEADA